MEAYEGSQLVGIDLHRKRSVVVRMSGGGEVLEAVRITNDAGRLTEVVGRAGPGAPVVLEATYGWYWAADALAAAGNAVHLAHPLGVKAFEYRRVKNDVRDAADLVDLLRMGRLPEAWICPPATRELRELVRHRHKLVAMRSSCKAQVHAVLAGRGVPVAVSDLFGAEGTRLLDKVDLPGAPAVRVASYRRLIAGFDAETDLCDRAIARALAGDPDYQAVREIPGIGPVLGAVLVAEIGDITRFARPEQLTSWAGLTPRHHESDTKVHRGRITKQGSKLVRWAVIESVQRLGPRTTVGVLRDRVAGRRGRNIAVVAAARHQLELVFYALRDHHVRALDHRPDAA
jgi:transposase